MKVIGSAEFTLVASTTSTPFRRIGLSRLESPSYVGFCSSWLYGSNMIALSAHCFEEGPSEEQFSFQTFRAGYTGESFTGGTTPYGQCGWAAQFVPAGWYNHHTRQYDFAAVRLNCGVGYTTGWFNLYNWDGFDADGRNVTVTGYPVVWSGNYRMYYANTPPQIQDDYSFFITYKIDTEGGDSGAPVYRYATDTINGCTGYCVFGIHSGGDASTLCVPTDSGSGQCNIARKITGGVYDYLNAARTA